MTIKIGFNIQNLKVAQPEWGEDFEFVTEGWDVLISDQLELLKSDESTMKIWLSESWSSEVIQEDISVIDPLILNHPQFSKILIRSLGGDGGVNLDQLLDEENVKLANFKMMDASVRGQYSDLLTDIISRNERDSIRPYQWFNQLILFLSYLEEKGVAQFPLDVDCLFSNKGMIVQLLVPVENFFKDYLTKAFQNSSSFEDPFFSCLRGLEQYSHGTDFTYVASAQILILTGLWTSDAKPRFGSISFHQLPTFQQGKKETGYKSSRLELVKEAVLAGKSALPGESIEVHELSQYEKCPHLVQMKKFVQYIKGKNLPEDKIVIEGMPQLAEEFYRVSGGEKLNPEEMKLAFKVLSKPEEQEEFEMVVQSLESVLPIGEGLTKVVGHLEEMNLDELIKVSALAAEPEQRTIISGVTQKMTSEVWKVKRLEVSMKLEEQLSKKKNVTTQDVKSTLNAIFEESMGFTVPGFSDAMAAEGLEVVQEKWAKAKPGDMGSNDKISQLESALKMRNQMISKMKTIVDELKDKKVEAQVEEKVPASSGGDSTKSLAELRIVKGKLEFMQKSYNDLMEAKQSTDNEVQMLKLELSRKSQEQINTAESSPVIDNISALQNTIVSKNQQIEKVTGELRNLEDVNKSLSLKVKALEQKTKFLQSQVDSAASQVVDTRFVQKIKQLESLYSNSQEDVKKLQAELQARKAESHKHALENKTMKSKMHQLERQVANLSKKRAG